MNVQISEHPGQVIVVQPMSRLDAFTAPALRERLLALLDDGFSRFVFDLSQVPFLDSAGMGVLVRLHKRAREQGGEVKLVWPAQEAGRRIIRLTRFDRVFAMAETAEEALRLFGG